MNLENNNDVSLLENEDHLINHKNYYIYADMVKNRTGIKINVPKEINFNTINDHIDGISAILKDGIETDFIRNCRITISWGRGVECDLSIVDYWFNLFMWSLLVRVNTEIRPKHIFFDTELKRKDIKKFIDKFFLIKNNKIQYNNCILNDSICTSMTNFGLIETFSYYLVNTINNEDDIALMKACPEFYDLCHLDMSGVPFEDIKDVGQAKANRAIEIIKDSKKYIGYEHGLTNSFKASEAINPRQYKEVRHNIGTKPNNEQGVYPYVINKSFSTGGVNDPLSYFIESSTARTAQILSKTNVGDSGDFARLLGLNNIDTLLNFDPNYECLTQNFIKFEVKTAKHLSSIKDRYYRDNPRGIEKVIDDENDKGLIGRTVYLRSPMTCSCNSMTRHICHKCYGNLYYTNIDINVGKMAAEELSAKLTQKLLSAKHLLEVLIQKILWNEFFYTFFQVEVNAIKIHEDFTAAALKGYELIINPDDIILVDNDNISGGTSDDDDDDSYIILEDDIGNYSEYVDKFIIRSPQGEEFEIFSQDSDSMYISTELNQIIRRKAYNKEDKIVVPMNVLFDDEDESIIMFYIKVNNNELSKTMNDIINVINKAGITSKKTKEEAIQDLVDLCIEGDVDVDAVHLEVLLSNQLVNPENILEKVNWNVPNAAYRLITLNQALTNNPSIIISLLYQDIHKTLYSPLSFAKRGPSFFDLFYMEKPQIYISDELLTDDVDIKQQETSVVMARVVDKEK